MILLSSLTIVALYIAWTVVCLERNYVRARSMNIPLIRLQVDPMNILWVVLEPQLWKVLDMLPINWGSFGRYSRRGWFFGDKAYSHLQHGPIFALVTPRDIYIYVADPGAVHDIFTRREDFLRPCKMYSEFLTSSRPLPNKCIGNFAELLEIYGPCISTAEWADRPRHRKVVAAPFNPSTMRIVWTESLRQTEQMLSYWTASGNQVPSFSKDTRTLSLNVLAATGFRQEYEFQGSGQPSTKGGQVNTYRDALQTVLDSAIFLMLVPPRLLSFPFLPRSWRSIARAAEDFKKYMLQMLDDETELLQQGSKGTGNLITSFLKALDVHQKAKTVSNSESQPRGLSISEILGNFFVIDFAGHDTTANTLAFAVLLLAANPEVQEWVAEELDNFIPKNAAEWEYTDLFPKLKRCQAVFLETLRLYPPILALPKWTNDYPQLLKVGGREVVIPPRTNVSSSLLAIQTHPAYWTEPLVWKPSRWAATQQAQGNIVDGEAGEDETLLPPPTPHTFFPWSDGPQNCPGAKFSQVEGVAVLAKMLKTHRLEIVRTNVMERFEEAKERVMRCVEDCDMQLLLRMTDADRVKIKVRRIAS